MITTTTETRRIQGGTSGAKERTPARLPRWLLSRTLIISLLAGVGGPWLVACADVPSEQEERGESGRLRLGLSSQLGGSLYFLEATFVVSGPETAQLSSVPFETTLERELVPGFYSLEVQPDFRILREAGGELVPVPSELLSSAQQPFEIASDATTRVAYRFSIDGETTDFTPGELAIDFELVAPSPLGSDVLEVPGPRSRLIYDAERQALYAANRADQQVEEYRFESDVWRAVAPSVVPELTDIALLPDGGSLIALTKGAISEIELDTRPWAALARAGNPDPFCGGYFDQVVMGNAGKAFIVFNLAECSGFTPSYLYDVVNHSLAATPYFEGYLYQGLVGASADGSRIYAGSNGVSPAQPVKIFDPATDSISDSAVNFNLSAVSVSADASRIVLQNTSVYGRELSLTGFIPSGGVALAAHDASKMFVYRDDGAPRIDIHDLDGTLEPGAFYPILKTVELPEVPSDVGGLGSIVLAATPGDDVVFVSGDDRIVIVRVD